MAEYIERENYCENVCHCANEYCDKESCQIWKAPAADVAPVVHGRWIGSSGIFQGKCSVCGYMTYDKSADWARNYWPHCPNCGAKMDGKDGDT